MALPTAPLGQLPSMNMPYAIPTHDRGSSIWEKALAAFLVNAAGGVAQQVVENAMARDFAPEFGEEKAGGLSKLISGPKVGKADASQRRQQAFVADQNEAARMAAAGQSEADAANALLRQDRTIAAGRESDEMRLDAQNAQSYLDARNADLQRSRSLDDRSALARLESQLYNERPDVKSQAARDAAAAEEAKARTEFQRTIMQELSGRGKPAAGAAPAPANGTIITPAMQREVELRATQSRHDAMPFDAALQDIINGGRATSVGGAKSGLTSDEFAQLMALVRGGASQ